MTKKQPQEEVRKEFVSDDFIVKTMSAKDYLPLSRGWFGLKVLSVERDDENCGFIYNLTKKLCGKNTTITN